MRARFFEDATASGSLKGPLVGIKAVPLVSLKEAIDCLQGINFQKKKQAEFNLFKYLDERNSLAFVLDKGSEKLASGKYPTMTVDEAAAIYLYTMPGEFYRTLNEALRKENAAQIGSLIKYIKLLLTALYKLPIEKHTLYRGLKFEEKERPDFKKEEVLVWWSFSSSTRLLDVTEQFLKPTESEPAGPRSNFIIENVPCVNIEGLSHFPGESERLLLPGTMLKVLSVTAEFDNGRRDVQAEFIKGQAVFDFMHPEWPIDLFSAPKK
jgi:hypothetical protein